MLGSLLTRILILFLGYAYPAFECYKTVEKNRVEIEELRFWCQYWYVPIWQETYMKRRCRCEGISNQSCDVCVKKLKQTTGDRIIVAMLTVLERVGDVFISWLPMYGEGKVALFIYLWYPKTKGTWFVYKTFLRPYVARHETEIDRKLLEMRARVWDLTVFYWQNCAQYGHAVFFQALQYLAANSTKFATKTKTTTESQTVDDDQQDATAPAPLQPNAPLRKPSGKNKWPPESPPATPNGRAATVNRAMSEPPRSPKVVHPRHQTDGGQVDELTEKLRLRRSKPIQ